MEMGPPGSGTSGVFGYSPTPGAGYAGVFGTVYTSSGQQGTLTADDIVAGLWGDAADQNDGAIGKDVAGIVGTADGGWAGYFANTSSSFATLVGISSGNTNAGYFANDSATNATVYAYNGNSSTIGTLFQVFKADSKDGSCGVGGGGNLTCTGQMKMLATTGGGTKTVETYAPRSTENWMEDYGTGMMEKGVAVIKIDPAFAEMVSETEDYHVFLTPRADSKGLYVINATTKSFEVRESGGGDSSLKFDYKIVAKPRGLEAQRLVDVTDRFKAEQARSITAHTANAPRLAEGAVRPAARPMEHPLHGTQPLHHVLPNGPGSRAAITTVPHKAQAPIGPASTYGLR